MNKRILVTNRREAIMPELESYGHKAAAVVMLLGELGDEDMAHRLIALALNKFIVGHGIRCVRMSNDRNANVAEWQFTPDYEGEVLEEFADLLNYLAAGAQGGAIGHLTARSLAKRLVELAEEFCEEVRDATEATDART